MADNKAKLTTGSKGDIDLDILSPTIGQDVIDVRTLGSKGFFTHDPGFTSASCESKITYIDGEQGILLHRGFLSINSLLKPLISKFVISCYTVKHRLKNNMTYLKIR